METIEIYLSVEDEDLFSEIIEMFRQIGYIIRCKEKRFNRTRIKFEKGGTIMNMGSSSRPKISINFGSEFSMLAFITSS